MDTRERVARSRNFRSPPRRAMPVDLPTLSRARKLHRDAVEDVVNDSFPSVVRLAYGLAGRDDTGGRIVRQIVRRGLKMLPKWRDEGEPQRWFLHHTILACRRESPPADPESDLLLIVAEKPTTQYAAFIRALRGLPRQQVEAVLLHHGESFNARYLGIAMDCSTAAAQQHLDSATKSLRGMAGEAFDALIAELRTAYRRLSPQDRVQVPDVGRFVRLHVWPRRLWRLARVVLVLAMVAGSAWFGWRIVPLIEF